MHHEPLFDRKEIARTVQFLSAESAEVEHADVAFVLASGYMEPAHIAADLFRQGMVRYVLVTIDRSHHAEGHDATGDSDAEAVTQVLKAEGVPTDRIIIDDTSAAYGGDRPHPLATLAGRAATGTATRVLAVAEWYRCRRAVMTLKSIAPGDTRYFTRGFEPEGLPRLEWHLHPELTRHVLEELEMVQDLLDSSAAADIELEDGAWT